MHQVYLPWNIAGTCAAANSILRSNSLQINVALLMLPVYPAGTKSCVIGSDKLQICDGHGLSS